MMEIGHGTPETTPVERVYFAWDDALSRNDKAALLALYAPDAVIESPLVPHVLKSERGIVRDEAEIRALLDEVAARKPPARHFHRTGYLTDGKRLIREHPRETPNGEQVDFVEAMELNDQGLIQRHRVY
jgi:ketosteroid isomerase-like protein